MNKGEFNTILLENKAKIQRICRYYSSNIEDQEDLYQEILLQIWKSYKRFKGEAKISTWIYRIAINVALTFQKNNYHQLHLFVDADTKNLEEWIPESNEKEVFEEHIQLLEDELNMLPIVDKALMSLLMEGLSMKEIANILGLSEANVKVKIHRIKKSLSDNLKEQDYDKE